MQCQQEKSVKRQTKERIELINQERIRTFGENENSDFLTIVEADTIKQAEMKEKLRKEYLRRTRKPLETKLCNRNLIKEINS